jgi:uncharacterized protein YaaN involved in tellurite resistance
MKSRLVRLLHHYYQMYQNFGDEINTHTVHYVWTQQIILRDNQYLKAFYTKI